MRSVARMAPRFGSSWEIKLLWGEVVWAHWFLDVVPRLQLELIGAREWCSDLSYIYSYVNVWIYYLSGITNYYRNKTFLLMSNIQKYKNNLISPGFIYIYVNQWFHSYENKRWFCNDHDPNPTSIFKTYLLYITG